MIGRQFVPIPGSTQTVEYRAQSPDGPYSGPMLALVQGRYPSGAGQVAVTGGLAQTLQVRIGSVLSLPGHHQTVTGIVENPSDLNDQFVLVAAVGRRPAAGGNGAAGRQPGHGSRAFRDTFHGPLVWQARGASTQAAVAAGALGAVTVLMLLVSLVAAAAFAVIAARRQRQLGMLAAIGATRKQLRMVMVAGGAWWASSPPWPGRSSAWRRGSRPPRTWKHSPGTGSTGSRSPGTWSRWACCSPIRDGDRRGVVASAGRRPVPVVTRPVGPAAAAQARAPHRHRWPRC